jgi:chromosome segregation ATPase
MKSEKVFGLKEMALRTVLVAVTAAAGMALTGCSEQFTAIEQNQQAMQKMIQGGSRQMTDSRVAIENNQRQLQGSIETSTNTLARNMSTVHQKQLLLHNELREQLANMTNSIAALQESHTELGGGIASNTRNLANNMATVERNQLRMRNELGEHLANTTNSVAALQKNQAKLSAAIANNTRSLANNSNNIATIAPDLRELQQLTQAVQNDTREAMARMAAIEQGQDNLKHTVETNIHQLASNVELVVQNLARLEKALADVHNNTEKTAVRFALIESNQLNLQEQIETNIRQVIESIEALEQQNQTVSPADSDEEAVATEASVAVADDVDAAE